MLSVEACWLQRIVLKLQRKLALVSSERVRGNGESLVKGPFCDKGLLGFQQNDMLQLPNDVLQLPPTGTLQGCSSSGG